MRDLADALGWYSVPVPELARRRHRGDRRAAAVPARRGARGSRPRAMPGAHGHGEGAPELAWRPRHDALETLKATVEAHREDLSG